MNRILLATQSIADAGTVPLGVTLVFAALLVGLILCLALEEKIHAKKSIIAVVFALVCLLLSRLDVDDVATPSPRTQCDTGQLSSSALASTTRPDRDEGPRLSVVDGPDPFPELDMVIGEP